MLRAGLIAVLTAVLIGGSAGAGFAAESQVAGVAFVDANRNGARDPGERGRADVAVTNGLAVVRTDAQGRYALPAPGTGQFVAVTCPDDFRCGEGYRTGAGDFALAPSPTPDDFFFIQISDVHAYEQAQDFAEYSTIPRPVWIPQVAWSWLNLWMLGRMYAPLPRDAIVAKLRDALASSLAARGEVRADLADLDDTVLFEAFQAEFRAPGSSLGRAGEQVRAALDEVASLRPEFVISTGDLVLESNEGSPEAVERWFGFYRSATRATGVPFYDTIGNNELAGIQNDDFPADDPRYGKHYFERFYGPTHYSFDRGPFHFAALDTHQPAPTWRDDKAWDFGRMAPEVSEWLDADLAAHAGRVLVALNHEPFHVDPSWTLDYEPASDDGLFAKHTVAYALAGHTHWNGFEERGATTHITTGALSGLRWVLPTSLHPRGYRLFYASDGRLYSAWKRSGEPLVGFIAPQGSDGIYAAAKQSGARPNGSGTIDVVAVAADARGPFAELRLSRAGRAVPIERWGRYFVHARVESSAPAGDDGALVFEARRADGTAETARLDLP